MNEIPVYEEGGHFSVEIDGHTYSIPKHCPHRRGWLEYGMINYKRKTITCPLHFSTFSLETGEQISGPKCGKLSVS